LTALVEPRQSRFPGLGRPRLTHATASECDLEPCRREVWADRANPSPKRCSTAYRLKTKRPHPTAAGIADDRRNQNLPIGPRNPSYGLLPIRPAGLPPTGKTGNRMRGTNLQKKTFCVEPLFTCQRAPKQLPAWKRRRRLSSTTPYWLVIVRDALPRRSPGGYLALRRVEEVLT